MRNSYTHICFRLQAGPQVLILRSHWICRFWLVNMLWKSLQCLYRECEVAEDVYTPRFSDLVAINLCERAVLRFSSHRWHIRIGSVTLEYYVIKSYALRGGPRPNCCRYFPSPYSRVHTRISTRSQTPSFSSCG